MGRLIIHIHPDLEKRELERADAFMALPFEEKLIRLFALIDLSIRMNGGTPLKKPQGKGLIIRKRKYHGPL